MNYKFYYHKKNPKFKEMELNKKGYPIWKDSRKTIHKTQAEKKYSRELKPNEVVHHIDGDKLNFDYNNLIILDRQDHNLMERDMWKYTNVMTLHFIILFSAYIFLVGYLYSKNIYFISATLFLLLIALIAPLFPKTLRKLLFKFRILEKNK